VAPPEYRVTTTWEVEAEIHEVAAILREPDSLARWWPAAFLAVEAAPRPQGLGSAGRVWSKGWLPYTLRFEFETSELPGGCGVVVRVVGDFEGACVCTVTPRGPRLTIVFDWRVRVRKPVIRRWSSLLRPLFVRNHLWVMARGIESLRLELARRRQPSQGGESATTRPPPPGPTFPHGARYRRLRDVSAWAAAAWRGRWRDAPATRGPVGG